MRPTNRLASFLPFFVSKVIPTNRNRVPVFLLDKESTPLLISNKKSIRFLASLKSSTGSTSDKNINMSKIPSPPFQYFSGTRGFLELDDLNETIAKNESIRQEAFDMSSKIQTALIHHRVSIEQGQPESEREALRTKLEDLVNEALQKHQEYACKKNIRMANMSMTFGSYVRHRAYLHFLQTGKLLPQSALQDTLSDEEYLGGVIDAMNRDLSRYVIGRATERDVASVLLSRDLVSSVFDHLLEHDFRNGNLRRKYDGVKYSLKTCETVLYELSVTGCDIGTDEENPKAKRAKLENDILPNEELESLRERMVKRDNLRETLIKNSRDGQKAAKQAIYALHREDYKKAMKLIETCEKCLIEQLNPIVEEEPQLRYGCYANVLEEYAEAKMFYSWLAGESDKANADKPAGKVLLPSDFKTISLEPVEYLGGLCDLTGEIGRYAVKRGTLRDSENIKLCLETDMAIVNALESMCRLPGISKKMDPLRRGVEKLEKMLYELSLVQATGRNIIAEVNDFHPQSE